MFLASSTSSGDAGSIVGLVVVIALYFLPCIVAYGRGKVNSGGVLIINLLLGWTVIGWIVALAMAASGMTKKQQATLQTPPARVQLSPDGRHWWDGRQWQPMPTSGRDRPSTRTELPSPPGESRFPWVNWMNRR
jgi:hypothetical protein